MHKCGGPEPARSASAILSASENDARNRALAKELFFLSFLGAIPKIIANY